MKISGTYEGFYEYGIGYILPEFGQRVKMRVHLTEENGKLSGTVNEEESEISVHHPAIIEGEVRENGIFFIKRYTVETINVEEVLDSDSSNQASLDPIDHAGYIDELHNCLYGDWLIEAYLENEDGTKQTEPYYFRGIWFLSRIKD